MQPGSGRGHGTQTAAIDCLIALAVRQSVLALDVRRQWNVPECLQRLVHVACHQEPQPVEIVFAPQHLQRQPLTRRIVEQQLGSHFRRLAGPHLGQHFTLPHHALDHHLDAPATGLVAQQPRRNHPRVVEHQQIARPEITQKIGELPVLQQAIGAPQAQQAAAGTFCRRVMSDQLIGQIEAKIGELHAREIRWRWFEKACECA